MQYFCAPDQSLESLTLLSEMCVWITPFSDTVKWPKKRCNACVQFGCFERKDSVLVQVYCPQTISTGVVYSFITAFSKKKLR